tara:strand:- start:1087 stop:1272 length:186 start_codon:yes stop_codon:yes gene_type:complete
MTSFLKQKTDKGEEIWIASVDVNLTEIEIKWLLEGLEAVILPERSKRAKRALKRSLKELQT